MAGLLAPSERLTGTPRQRRDLRQRFTAIRAAAASSAGSASDSG